MSHRWRPQTSLRWLAIAVLVLAVGLGWYRDHTEAERELVALPDQIAVVDGQIEDIKSRLAGHVNRSTEEVLQKFSEIDLLYVSQTSVSMRIRFPWEADLYLGDVKRSLERNLPLPGEIGRKYSRLTIAPELIQLANAPEEDWTAAFTAVIDLLESSDVVTRALAFRVVRLYLVHQRDRLEPCFDHLVPVLVRSLESVHDEVRRDSVACLRAIGPAAKEAREALENMSRNDPTPELRIQAILAIGAVDEEYDVIPPAKDWIRHRQPAWGRVVGELLDLLPPEQAETYLREQYTAATNEAYRQVFARALTELSLRESSMVGE